MQKLVWGLLIALYGGSSTEANTQQPINEHKVPYIQNIVLYPDKHSWCKTTEIKQIVAYPGCSSVEIDNTVCVGACFSYSIPKTSPSAPGEVITPYCDSCQPSLYTWKEVKLTCQDDSGEDEEGVVELIKKVQVITNCTCSSCQEQNDANSLEHQKHSVLNDAEVPELMSFMLNHKKTSENDTENEEKVAESVLDTVKSAPSQDIDNIIDVDEEKEKDTPEDLVEDHHLEIVHVNKEAHLVPGPHHSLVIKPVVVEEHQNEKSDNDEADMRHHRDKEDEEVPSLLQNQFKIHDNEEFPDQLAVESRKEYDDKPTEVLTVPDLIYKSYNSTQHIQELLDDKEFKIEEVPEKKPETHHSHHHQHHSKEHTNEGHHNHRSHHLLKDDEHKGVKIVEVSDHHLKPAIEGTQLSYVVKSGEVNIPE